MSSTHAQTLTIVLLFLALSFTLTSYLLVLKNTLLEEESTLLFCTMIFLLCVMVLIIYLRCELEGEEAARCCYDNNDLKKLVNSLPLKSEAKPLPPKLEGSKFGWFFVHTLGLSWGVRVMHLSTKL